MPDYDNKVQIPTLTTYQAPKDGIVLLTALSNGWSQCHVGEIIFSACTYSGAPSSNSVVFAVPKGTDLWVTSSNGEAYFIPYK